MLEFALGSSILLASFAGTFEAGYTFYRYNTLATAVNDGAKYAAMYPYDSATSTPSTTYATAVQNIVVYGNPTGGTTPLLPNLTTRNVNVSVTFANSVPGTVTVYISGFSISSLDIWLHGAFDTKPTVTYPYMGVYSPYSG